VSAKPKGKRLQGLDYEESEAPIFASGDAEEL